MLVGAGLPSPYAPTACANNCGLYYKQELFVDVGRTGDSFIPIP